MVSLLARTHVTLFPCDVTRRMAERRKAGECITSWVLQTIWPYRDSDTHENPFVPAAQIQ